MYAHAVIHTSALSFEPWTLVWLDVIGDNCKFSSSTDSHPCSSSSQILPYKMDACTYTKFQHAHDFNIHPYIEEVRAFWKFVKS